MESVKLTDLNEGHTLDSLQRLDETLAKLTLHEAKIDAATERRETEFDRIMRMRDLMVRGGPMSGPALAPRPGPIAAPPKAPGTEPASSRRRAVLAAEMSDILFQQRQVGKINDIQSIEFLEKGLIAKRPVGKIRLMGNGIGTGFLVGEGLIMTAGHVIPTEAEASSMEFALDDEENYIGSPVPARIFYLDPMRFYWIDTTLDVAIVGLMSVNPDNPPLTEFGQLRITNADTAITPGAAVSIIQHPKGETKRIVVHNSHFISNDKSENAHLTCWYTGDTEGGSSGSPVFDAQWVVVAVHRRFVPETNEHGEILAPDGEPILVDGTSAKTLEELAKDHKISVYANEGARVSEIRSALATAEMPTDKMESLRTDLLRFWGSHPWRP